MLYTFLVSIVNNFPRKILKKNLVLSIKMGGFELVGPTKIINKNFKKTRR